MTDEVPRRRIASIEIEVFAEDDIPEDIEGEISNFVDNESDYITNNLWARLVGEFGDTLEKYDVDGA